MAIYVNGTIVKGLVKYAGTYVSRVICNGVNVWERYANQSVYYKHGNSTGVHYRGFVDSRFSTYAYMAGSSISGNAYGNPILGAFLSRTKSNTSDPFRFTMYVQGTHPKDFFRYVNLNDNIDGWDLESITLYTNVSSYNTYGASGGVPAYTRFIWNAPVPSHYWYFENTGLPLKMHLSL